MKIYTTKYHKLSGTSYSEILEKAKDHYDLIKKRSRRRPYVRSAYFAKEKIFLELFWTHLFDKNNWRDRARRLKYFDCAIDLIKNSRHEPKSMENVNKRSEILHRFIGQSQEGEVFYVQIKEDKRSGQKWLMSIFPE